nr:MAG TPA: hypothetical protein [Caudoviricetes sp.]
MKNLLKSTFLIHNIISKQTADYHILQSVFC